MVVTTQLFKQIHAKDIEERINKDIGTEYDYDIIDGYVMFTVFDVEDEEEMELIRKIEKDFGGINEDCFETERGLKKEFEIHASQTTSFKAIVRASSLEEANLILFGEGELDWDECGELEWVENPELTTPC